MSTPALVNAHTLEELGETIGWDKLDRLIDRFAAALGASFIGEGRDEQDLGREAHTLVSMAGMLGCDALSDACRNLEVRAKEGSAVNAFLADVRCLRDQTREALIQRRLPGASA